MDVALNGKPLISRDMEAWATDSAHLFDDLDAFVDYLREIGNTVYEVDREGQRVKIGEAHIDVL